MHTDACKFIIMETYQTITICQGAHMDFAAANTTALCGSVTHNPHARILRKNALDETTATFRP